jgi:DNA-binding NarL/FixJ family response regulator
MGRARDPDVGAARAGGAIRVLVADSCPATRAGVRSALEQNGCVVCAEAGDRLAAVEAALRERPDVCLLDTKLAGDGIEAATEMISKLPGATVVMFTDSPSDADFFAALRAGVSGYLLKDTDPAQLGDLVRSAHAGEAALSPDLVKRLIEQLLDRERRRQWPLVRDLTRREYDVFELLREGLTTAEIAERLSVATVTVRTHVASIVNKLGVPDRDVVTHLLQERWAVPTGR